MKPDNDTLQQRSVAKLSAEAVLGAVLDVPVLLPGALDRAVQHSDARDVAAWVVAMLAQGRGGTFDTVGPGLRDSLGEVLEACVGAAGGAPGDVQLVEVDGDFLRPRRGAVPEERWPLWFPGEQIPHDGIDSTAAIAAGLTFRPARDTAPARQAEHHPRRQEVIRRLRLQPARPHHGRRRAPPLRHHRGQHLHMALPSHFRHPVSPRV